MGATHILIIGIILIFGAAGALALEKPKSPQLSLDSTSPHLEIWVDGWVPEIRLYANKKLEGEPIFHLNARGLFQKNELLCRWPGEEFDSANAANMVLGYRDVGAGIYEGCGKGSPILSTWGDGGTGAAVLYISVVHQDGDLITTSHQGQKFYFDLKAIPKRNRELLKAGKDFKAAGD